ncbi:membrane protein insertion efficiency factor YidD [Vineibacter terrae]|uniref:membrane protein insertion efficiency factor YidD n=1 Tax=Vineibacter terrae TaxID=2586908 RepID=UPI002E2FFE5A|nr:membrane protein insertion efficiency factor YidD [Vineibacter terrae]HEX2891183.1 membrane protein insertion efficiency factor YidD [Vineibacter terrae]
MRQLLPIRLLTGALTLALRGLVRFYQLVPAYFFRGVCRFEPTCSRYANEALQTHGPVAGTWLTVRRICRCHPWGGLGYDPVPPLANPSGRLPAAPPSTPRPLEF